MRIVLIICDHYWRVSESMCVVQVQFILKKSAIRGQNVHKLVNFYSFCCGISRKNRSFICFEQKIYHFVYSVRMNFGRIEHMLLKYSDTR